MRNSSRSYSIKSLKNKKLLNSNNYKIIGWVLEIVKEYSKL